MVYGDADKSWGGEGWTCWTLIWLGHQGPIRLLKGGITLWKDSNFPLVKSDNIRSVRPVSYEFQIRPEVKIGIEDIKSEEQRLFLIDTRSHLEWFGGHLPDAIHIKWTSFFSGKYRIPIDSTQMRKLLKENGIDLSRPVVYYCEGGIRSAYAWIVHQLSGLPVARNYEGGMVSWKASFSQ